MEEKLTALESLGLTQLEQATVFAAMELEADRPKTGFEVLLAVSRCMALEIPPPDWLVRDFAWRVSQVSAFEVASLDDPTAFGPVPARKRGEHLSTAALRQMWEGLLQIRFAPEGTYPRTTEGYAQASEDLDGIITPKQIRKLLPPLRRNTRGHKPQKKPTIVSTNAHDPFLLARKRPKR